MGEKMTFFEKCCKNLAYRIMTVILVTAVPLCLVTVAIAMVTLYSSFNQMQERALRQTENTLNRLEADILRIENYAEEFVDEYMTELNAEDGFSDQLVSYDMTNDLQRLFSHTGLKGAVYLADSSGTYCRVKSGDALYTPQEIEVIRSYTAENAAAGFEGFTLAGRGLIRREYVYANAKAGFIVDIPASLNDLISNVFTDETIVYFQTGQSVFRFFPDGSIELVSEASNSPERTGGMMENIVWQGQGIPLSMSIHYPWTVMLGGIPTADWVLLPVAVLCLLLLPLIWYVLRKDVLEPVERLTKALQEIRRGNESYQISERSSRYASEMLYLFESFDAAAEEMQRSKEKDVKMVKAELDNLRLQVNPHMLLNSYNMIFALAQSKKFDTIQDYSLLLVKYFRLCPAQDGRAGAGSAGNGFYSELYRHPTDPLPQFVSLYLSNGRRQR